jgi:hypothetical protein
MEEKSMTRNHEGEIIGRGIIEKGSLREASGRHLGGIWEASGRHLGHSRRLPDAPGSSKLLQEAPGGLGSKK